MLGHIMQAVQQDAIRATRLMQIDGSAPVGDLLAVEQAST